MIAYLPNKQGHYKPVRVPQYIQDILKNVTNEYDYTWRLRGVNSVRPAYGIEADLSKLEKWAKRYHSDFEIKRINKQRRNYYGLFFMSDPIVYQLEKVGLLS